MINPPTREWVFAWTLTKEELIEFRDAKDRDTKFEEMKARHNRSLVDNGKQTRISAWDVDQIGREPVKRPADIYNSYYTMGGTTTASSNTYYGIASTIWR